MKPSQLEASHFTAYPPLARQLAVAHLPLLRQLPVSFLPLLLREVIAYDYKFPAERADLDHQFRYLEALDPGQLRQSMAPFAQLQVTSDVEGLDWVNTPGLFSEQLSATLWKTHQIETFRSAAVQYVDKMNAARKEAPLATHRLGIVVVGHGVKENGQPVFRKLRPHGVHYAKVDDRNGYDTILKAVAARAARYPEPFAHWRVEGGALDAFKAEGLTSISYASLTPVRAQLQSRIQKAFESNTGSEALRTTLAKVRPEDVGLPGDALNHFELSLLTEGSGTQIFSTTFVQWSAREIWRRAQPVTLLARFTERQKEDASREMFLEARRTPQLDPDGSLVDAEMGAYYTWINQQRLSGAAAATFLVWFENQGQALVIAPGIQRGSTSAAPTPLAKLIGEVS